MTAFRVPASAGSVGDPISIGDPSHAGWSRYCGTLSSNVCDWTDGSNAGCFDAENR